MKVKGWKQEIPGNKINLEWELVGEKVDFTTRHISRDTETRCKEKRVNSYEMLTILNVYVTNNRDSTYLKQKPNTIEKKKRKIHNYR